MKTNSGFKWSLKQQKTTSAASSHPKGHPMTILVDTYFLSRVGHLRPAYTHNFLVWIDGPAPNLCLRAVPVDVSTSRQSR